MIPALLLALQLAALAWFVRGDLSRLHPALADPAARYRRWIVKSWLGFALPALVTLLLLGEIAALWRLPATFASAAAQLPFVGGRELAILAASGAGGAAIATAATVLVTRRRRLDRPWGTVGDVAKLLPRHRAELLPAAALSVSAGMTEELAYRLALALTLAMLGVPALWAFALATLLFGAMHRYQGWAGVLATTVLGGLLCAIYLSTRLFWLPVAIHVAIDLNGLVLRPALTGAWRR
jgi:uncharacterized protein